MTTLLSRRLPLASALLTGRRVATNASAFVADHGPLPKAIVGPLAAVATATAALEDGVAQDPSALFAFDRVADGAVGQLARLLESTAAVFSGHDRLPLTADQKAVRDAAELLLGLAFPNGTGFLKLPYGAQFLGMEKLVRTFREKAAKTALKTLGATAELAALRVEAVTKTYGDYLGVGDAPKAAVHGVALSEAWHEAYEGLLIAVLGAFHGTNTRSAAEAAFAAPYQEEVERIRNVERKSRRSKKDPSA